MCPGWVKIGKKGYFHNSQLTPNPFPLPRKANESFKCFQGTLSFESCQINWAVHSLFKQLKGFNWIYRLYLEECTKDTNIPVYIQLNLLFYLLKDSFNNQLIIGMFNTKGSHSKMLVSSLWFYSIILLSLQNLHLLKLHWLKIAPEFKFCKKYIFYFCLKVFLNDLETNQQSQTC